MLSKKSLEKFKRLYQKEFDEELNNKEATRKAEKLLRLYRAVYGGPLDYLRDIEIEIDDDLLSGN